MTGSGAAAAEDLDGSRLRVAIVAARWHEQVMEGLIVGANRGLSEAGVTSSRVFRTPGSFELPVAAQALAHRYDAVVALGAVIRGDTPHFDYICRAVTDGLVRVTLDTGVPIGFGVLTCDDEQQALDRAGLAGSGTDKGYEAARAAIATALSLREVAES